MSIRGQESTDTAFADAGGADWSVGDFTLACWVKPMSTPQAGGAVYVELSDSPTEPTQPIVWQNDSGGTKFSADTPAIATNTFASAFSSGTWYYIVISRAGETIKFRYFDDSTSTTPIQTLTDSDDIPYTQDTLVLGADGWDVCPNAEFESLKLYIGAELTDSECRTESQNYAWQKAGANRWAWELRTTAANSQGFNERTGAGQNFTNSGFVNGASTPTQLGGGGGGTGPSSYAPVEINRVGTVPITIGLNERNPFIFVAR